MEAKMRSPGLVDVDRDVSGMCRGHDLRQVRGDAPVGRAGHCQQLGGWMRIQHIDHILNNQSQPDMSDELWYYIYMAVFP